MSDTRTRLSSRVGFFRGLKFFRCVSASARQSRAQCCARDSACKILSMQTASDPSGDFARPPTWRSVRRSVLSVRQCASATLRRLVRAKAALDRPPGSRASMLCGGKKLWTPEVPLSRLRPSLHRRPAVTLDSPASTRSSPSPRACRTPATTPRGRSDPRPWRCAPSCPPPSFHTSTTLRSLPPSLPPSRLGSCA